MRTTTMADTIASRITVANRKVQTALEDIQQGLSSIEHWREGRPAELCRSGMGQTARCYWGIGLARCHAEFVRQMRVPDSGKAAEGNYEPAATAAITPIAIMQAACTKKNANRMAATEFVCSNQR
jgi:hypothetical protein